MGGLYRVPKIIDVLDFKEWEVSLRFTLIVKSLFRLGRSECLSLSPLNPGDVIDKGSNEIALLE